MKASIIFNNGVPQNVRIPYWYDEYGNVAVEFATLDSIYLDPNGTPQVNYTEGDQYGMYTSSMEVDLYSWEEYLEYVKVSQKSADT